MAWNSDKALTQTPSSAYVENETFAAASSNPYIKAASALLLEQAKQLMDDFKKENINLVSRRQDGSEYKSKAIVSVKQGSHYDNASKKKIFHFREDRTPIMVPAISIRPAPDDVVNLYAKEDISNGIIFQNMTATVWNNHVPTNYKLEDIKSGNISVAPATQAVLNSILSKDIIKQSLMEQLAYEINKLFASTTNKVPSKKPDEKGNYRLVNNAYAQYVNDDFGEKCVLRTHTDNIVVELGITSDGSKFAKATNFDMGIETPDGKRYESIFINKPEDLENLNDESIMQAIAAYKEIDMPKIKGQKAERPSAGRKAPISQDDDYPFDI